MTRQTLKDSSYRIIGYIEDMHDGRLKATNFGGRILGYYDPRRDTTTDFGGRILGKGNSLSALIERGR